MPGPAVLSGRSADVAIERLKAGIPWQAKIAAKIVLSRLPVSSRTWRLLRVFRHGDMAELGYAESVFRAHFAATSFARKGGEFVCLEVGPGDSLLSALLARLHGARTIYLVDSGRFATEDVALYRAVAERLSRGGAVELHPERWLTIDDFLRDCNAVYLTDGLRSLGSIPSGAVDFCWSHAVLEHVRRGEFGATVGELRRVLDPAGAASHQVDLRDHLSGRLESLRFRESLWESDFLARSGFYTNRIRCAEMLDLFRRGGFEIADLHLERWAELPTPRQRMAAPFGSVPDEDLKVRGFRVGLRPR